MTCVWIVVGLVVIAAGVIAYLWRRDATTESLLESSAAWDTDTDYLSDFTLGEEFHAHRK